jgi:hypothetical protein
MPYWTGVVAVLSVASMTLGIAGPGAAKYQAPVGIFLHCACRLCLDRCGSLLSIRYDQCCVLPGCLSLTNLAAFGVVVAFWKVVGSDEIADYAGLSRRAPWLLSYLLVAFLSLAGMPPLGGFIGKVLVFAAAVDAEYYWLAFVGIINSIVGLVLLSYCS